MPSTLAPTELTEGDLNPMVANSRARAAVPSSSECSAYQRPPSRCFETQTLTVFSLKIQCPLNATRIPVFPLSSPMAISRCPKENNGLSLKRKQTHKSGFCSCHCTFRFTFILKQGREEAKKEGCEKTISPASLIIGD